MTTRSKNCVFQPKHLNITTKYPLPLSLEPTSPIQALKDPQWRHAMCDEINALVKNGTWELVPRTPTQNIVGCKWVFRIKRHPDGSIDRYKARLVAKGFHQRPGIDYHDTFSPVVKPTTIRLVLSVALSRNWKVHQLDVNNAFLHGRLSEQVFMSQPPGFIDASLPNHVCRLHKALYGLKQAPRAWYNELQEFLLLSGFVKSKSDASLFIYNTNSTVIYFLVYVDDLLVTGNSKVAIVALIAALSRRFSIKDLGDLHFFLGIEVIPTPTGLFLSQQKYIRDLLARTKMEGVKDYVTPMSTSIQLLHHDGSPSADATLYRSVIGGLQYLALTRPDIAYPVNKLAQYMQAPNQTHWAAAKRILRYLKNTLHFGLHLKRHQPFQLTAYSDADWAGDRDNYCSISAYIIYFGGNPISWCSKKQRTVARSSTEAEYRAIASTAAEISWLVNLLSELGITLSSPPHLLCDNLGATYLCANPIFHSRMKHIAIDYHFVRDKVFEGSLKVSHVSTTEQLADLFTKPLAKQRFLTLRSKIGVFDGDAILRGHNRMNRCQSLHHSKINSSLESRT
ncbi:retrovirus-related pol polyprotein from transposon RE1 [Citrus sinensis]|nr:retrovirus-related pol polyprotein from transposon RE1 [Citrus sinensis]